MKHRLQFTAKKLIRMALLLLGVSLVTFLLMCASPLDPLQTNVGQVALGSMSPEQVEQLEAYWGVDTPPAERYIGWLSDVLHGDFGTSLLYRQPVLAIIGQRLAGSVLLLLSTWVISGVLGMVLGVTAGAFRGRWPDRLIRGYCLLISSTPAFWLAILLLLIFAVWLGWFPVGLSVPAGISVGYAGRQGLSRCSPGADSEHYGSGEYRAPYKRENDRCDGVGLHTFCPCPRRIHRFCCSAARFAECGAPGDYAAVCLNQRNYRGLGTCGAGVFLSGARTGRGDCRAWE